VSMTADQFYQYELNWIGVLGAAGKTQEEAIAWLKDSRTHRKPRVRVKMGRQRLNAEGLKLWDPFHIRFPWYRGSYQPTGYNGEIVS